MQSSLHHVSEVHNGVATLNFSRTETDPRRARKCDRLLAVWHCHATKAAAVLQLLLPPPLPSRAAPRPAPLTATSGLGLPISSTYNTPLCALCIAPDIGNSHTLVGSLLCTISYLNTFHRIMFYISKDCALVLEAADTNSPAGGVAGVGGPWLAEVVAAVLVRASAVAPTQGAAPAASWDASWDAFSALLARHLAALKVHRSAQPRPPTAPF